MKKVISLDEKLKLTAEQRAAALQKKKQQAVRRLFQCNRCASKCERCGVSSSTVPGEREDEVKIPYHFCESCTKEYLDYIRCLQGKGDSDAYWHNHQWMKVWQTWIEYQGAIDQYLRTREFRRMMDELGSDWHGCDS